MQINGRVMHSGAACSIKSIDHHLMAAHHIDTTVVDKNHGGMCFHWMDFNAIPARKFVVVTILIIGRIQLLNSLKGNRLF